MLPKFEDEEIDAFFRLALSMYIGEKCKYCNKEYKTLEDLVDVVRADGDEFRLACKDCYHVFMRMQNE